MDFPHRLLAVLGLAAGLAGCAADGDVASQGAPAVERERIPPDFVPAFDALQAAVEAGDDALARRILAGILLRRPPAHLVEFARGYERILDGRALVRSLELRLASEEVEGSALDYRLVLLASHDLPRPVSLHLPPGTLVHATFAMDAVGNESKRATSHTTSAVEEVVIEPDGEARIPLLNYELPLGGALAVRERWTLELRSGEIRFDEEGFPAREPPVAPAERIRRAPYLPRAAVEPAELVRYAQGEKVYAPPLIERAVRITIARRDEALDLLAPVAERLEEEDPDRLESIAPALRWLAHTARPGNQPGAWASWFRARRARQLADQPRPKLDVPAEPAAE